MVICVPNLGLSSDESSLIRTSVSVVIHSAATVRFDEHLYCDEH